MIKRISVIVILFFVVSCQLGDPPVSFSEEALAEELMMLNGDIITLASVLDRNTGKIIVIDFWASWCKDCIIGMPKLKQLQEAYPGVAFVFLSLDRNETGWKRGIEKYKLQGKHYYMQSGMKGDLGRFVGLDWIPRYMVINKKREIKIFKAINAGDINVKKIIDKLSKV